MRIMIPRIFQVDSPVCTIHTLSHHDSYIRTAAEKTHNQQIWIDYVVPRRFRLPESNPSQPTQFVSAVSCVDKRHTQQQYEYACIICIIHTRYDIICCLRFLFMLVRTKTAGSCEFDDRQLTVDSGWHTAGVALQAVHSFITRYHKDESFGRAWAPSTELNLLTHQTSNYPVTCFVSRPSGITVCINIAQQLLIANYY